MTITKALPTPVAVRKAEVEIAEFRKFQELSDAFVQVNEQICRLRPAEERLTPHKGTAEAAQREVPQESMHQSRRSCYSTPTRMQLVAECWKKFLIFPGTYW